jgi:hypothetical protein
MVMCMKRRGSTAGGKQAVKDNGSGRGEMDG